ncbi:hypothetical protein GT354_02645 [Streptomyces sp. SID3343]|nr:hypothetical protein [Streptomyces sp. SID3343]
MPGGGLPPHTPRDSYAPVPPQRPPARRGRMIAVVAVVVALIAGGVVVGVVLSKDDDKGANANPDASPTGPQNPTAPGTTAPTTSNGPTATPSTSAPPSIPPNSEMIDDPAGFSVVLPKNSTRTVFGEKKDQIKYLSADRRTVFLISTTQLPNGPMANFESVVEPGVASKPNYKKIQMRSYTPLPAGTKQAVLWEYTWDGDPIGNDTSKKEPSHAYNLGIVTTAGKDYAVYASSYASDWDLTSQRFDVMRDSFRSR